MYQIIYYNKAEIIPATFVHIVTKALIAIVNRIIRRIVYFHLIIPVNSDHCGRNEYATNFISLIEMTMILYWNRDRCSLLTKGK